MRENSINEDRSEQRGCFIKMLAAAAVVMIIFIIFKVTGLIRFDSTTESVSTLHDSLLKYIAN